jgi:hypothetical protein
VLADDRVLTVKKIVAKDVLIAEHFTASWVPDRAVLNISTGERLWPNGRHR